MSSDLNHHVDTVLGSSTARQGQGKRAACDRCRGQKLRCLREAPGGISTGKCVRCNTAGAVCSFSVSKRAGRPPASATANSAERKARGKGLQEGHASTNGRPPLLNKISNEDMLEGPDGQNDVGHTSSSDEFIPQPLMASFMNDMSWGPVTDMPWIDEGVAASYDQGDLTGSTNFDSFIQDYNWTLPNSSSSGQFSQSQPSAFIDNPITANLKPSDEIMTDSPPLMFGTKALNPQLISSNMENGEGSMNFSMMNLTPKPKDKDARGGDLMSEPSSAAGGDVHHRRMQELSELGMNLYSQVIANEEYHQARIINNSVVPCEQLVGNILKSSATFLKLLGSFYPPTTIKRSASKASVFDSSDGEISPSEASIFSDFSDIATNTTSTTTGDRSQDYQWKNPGPAGSLLHNGTSGDNDGDAAKPFTADMTLILQLLTCYIRIIHLHSIFYTQVHDCLTAPPNKRENPLPPIFPGMHVGGLSLDDFPNFQIKLLLQISTHVLGEIEKALGLPDGYRISKKNPHSQGILEASVSVQFVEMTMRENVRTGLMGIEKDRVKSIRDKLASLRVLLKGTINI